MTRQKRNIRQIDPETPVFTGLTRDRTFYIDNGEIKYALRISGVMKVLVGSGSQGLIFSQQLVKRGNFVATNRKW